MNACGLTGKEVASLPETLPRGVQGFAGAFRLKNAEERFNGLLLRRYLAAWLVILPACVRCCVGTAAEVRTEANVPVEVSFTAQRSHAGLPNEVVLDVVFNEPDGTTRRVPAFWLGGSDWKVRYASATPGVHRWRSECVDQQDAGLHGLTGTVEVVPYVGDNPLFKHGPVRIAADRRHFMHADGTPFFWLGDTWWMGLTKRLEWPGDFHTLAVDRRAKGFNVVQIVAGLYPDMPAFDVRGANEAGFPWETNYARLRPEYFNAADRRIAYLAEQGLVPCIVGAWGYHLPWLGAEKMRRHWREIIARWGAWPVVWCAAGETTMPFYLSSTKAADTERQQCEWTDIIRFIHATDPFGRLVTCHPSQTARASVTDPSVLDFDMQQTGHGSPAWKHALLARQGWEVKPVMPTISGEARYEALEIRPTLTAREVREAFWAHLISSGCAGHTYGANGIWQVNRRGQPYGPSPGGNNWGTTPWDDAMRLPGSEQLSLARGFLAALPWSQFVPQPDSAAWAEPEKAPAPGDLIGAPKGAARAGASGDDTSAPYTCGIGDRLRLVYVLEPRAVSVCALRSSARYRLTLFDPVTGQRAPTAPVTTGANGQLRVEPPPHGHDWVLLLEAE